MKTIFIAINGGLLARNILRTDVFKILKEHPNIRIVLFLPPGIPDYFKKEFEMPGKVILEEIHPFKYGALRRFIFLPFLHGLIFTETTKIIYKYGSQRVKRHIALSYLFCYCMYSVLHHFSSLKRLARWIEFHWYKDLAYECFFEEYKPDLVFMPTIMSVREVALLKSAKRRNIPQIAMPKSWDHLDKFLHQFVPSNFIVQNTYLRNSAINLQEYNPKSVSVSGYTQFDIYTRKDLIWSREEFCKRLNIEPKRKLLMFGSEGVWTKQDENIVDMLHTWIMEESLNRSTALLVRPHPADCYKRRFDRFKGLPNLAVIDYRLTHFFPDHWDPSYAEMIEFLNILYHMDININSFSSLTLDAVCFDKPIINIAFDMETVSFKDSIIHMYERANYKQVVESGAVYMAYTREEFKKAINTYLEHPERFRAERERIRKYLCGRIDGKAGDRIARHILFLLNENGGRDLSLREKEVIETEQNN